MKKLHWCNHCRGLQTRETFVDKKKLTKIKGKYQCHNCKNLLGGK